ncbi:MAG TPA: TetR/AcrR family transcriptional regulator [Streptomyces sp.]|nr:TetR/AcrR family transcriptional regulator [Streptomyces sp.]
MTTPRPPAPRPSGRADLVADAAIGLLAARGLRGLTHRAVDESAGLPPGSTSNVARTRAALLELTVRRLAVREARVLLPEELPAADAGLDGFARMCATAVHRSVTEHRELTVARYELALEATRRPELRAHYDRTGTETFREPLVAMLREAGSPEPARHALSVIAWCDGMLFSCTAGAHHAEPPSLRDLLTGLEELLRGMLPG